MRTRKTKKDKQEELSIGSKAIQFLESVKGLTRSVEECVDAWIDMSIENKASTIEAFNALYPLFEPNPNN